MKAGEKKISENLMKELLEFLKRYNHTFLEAAERFGLSVTKLADLFDTHVQIERKALREVISVDEFISQGAPRIASMPS